MIKSYIILLIIIGLFFVSCKPHLNSNQEMVELLRAQNEFENTAENPFCAEAVLKHIDSVIISAAVGTDLVTQYVSKANALLQLGQEQKAVDLMDSVLYKTFIIDYILKQNVTKTLALCYLRLGERTNCIRNHSSESCLFPIAGGGIHKDKTGSQKAIVLYKRLLKENPSDYESRWLLNVACMTIGGYPQLVPPEFFLKTDYSSNAGVQPFKDLAANLGLAVRKMGGGSIIEDFDNDGYADLISSSTSLSERMHYFHNNRNGSFTDLSESSGLQQFTGGLNIMQTDYNNDGLKDIFVLRGAWRKKFGKEPNSLLKNNGDGTFTDVTKQSGLLSFYPTQTATWADFNNDGWLDVFIGNENSPDNISPSELYINNKNGTFTEIAAPAGCDIKLYIKGVTSGDFNNDGLPDIYISTLNGRNILLKNVTPKNGPVKFIDATRQAGLSYAGQSTFATWFWDFNNDGWLDIMVCGYGNSEPIGYSVGAESLRGYSGNDGKILLFRNTQNGRFENVSLQAGFNKIAFAMGANFGDIDNDGFLDFYLGTGNPLFSSLISNKLFKNNRGENFTDVSASSRVGSLQKGHGVSFADLNNDGYLDIHVNLGGAYPGDAYQNALFMNPATNNNSWIDVLLEGTASNKVAIGARLKITFTEQGIKRAVYRDVNSGGSFGSNPLIQHIGIGKAMKVDKIEVKWPVTHTEQTFNNIKAGTCVKVKEGSNKLASYKLSRLNFNFLKPDVMCLKLLEL